MRRVQMLLLESTANFVTTFVEVTQHVFEERARKAPGVKVQDVREEKEYWHLWLRLMSPRYPPLSHAEVGRLEKLTGKRPLHRGRQGVTREQFTHLMESVRSKPF
jgi:hypothetical protein